MVIKQVPGADSVVMVYDKRDRLVLTQDGNQRAANKWSFTKYDGLNRPIITGLYTHGSSIDSKTMTGLLSMTTISESYDGSTSDYGYSNAVFPTANCEVLTVNYYDDYDFTSLMSDPDGNFDYINSEIEAVPASPGQDEFAFDRVKGQLTGSQTKILNSTTFLWTANYFDDHYRLIQTTASNHKGGFDRVTNVYDFVGKVLRSKTRYAMPPNLDMEIYQRFSYDHAGRLLDIWHRIEGGPEVLISSNEYNEIGQLVTKKLHYDNSATEYVQTVDYRYNIRGWLANMNDPSAPAAEDLFNMQLKYNLPTGKGGAAQFNGNISEAIWKSAGLDRQSYGYEYDPINRMTEASYYDIAKPARDGYYNERIGDPGESDPARSMAYDLNGNIQNLLRNGKKDAGDYDVMDKLHYDYGSGAGNQLMFVSDDEATAPQKEGFIEIVEGSTDYAYDNNGNLTKDENKGITGIEYNHLNLPWKVSKSAAEYLIYTYDATGRKLSQQVFGTTAKTTDYVGELVFEDNALQFILHAEGRIVADTESGAPDPWEYQYFLKDHLGNIRVVFSEKTVSEEYTATMEDAAVGDEMADFAHYPSVRSSLPEFDHTDQGSVYTKSMMLHGGENSQIGLAKSFDVNPGDVFDLEVYAKYEAPTGNPSDIDGLFLQVVSAFTLGANTTPRDGAAAYSAFEDLFQGGNPWINSSMWEEAPPKAYLNYLLFDENFVLVDFGFDQVSTDCEQDRTLTPVPHDYLSLHVNVEQKGYLYVYLSNEQPVAVTNVYFDDMKIVHYSAVEQVSDYYPFGLTFNSYQRENSVPQDYKYNGKEDQTELDLGWLDYGMRMYQPELGRWGVIDPIAAAMPGHSPYGYAFNSPVRFVDVNGLYPKSILTFDPTLGWYGGYRFTRSAAHLLSLVSGVDKVYIERAIIQDRAPGQYRPFYRANRGGGAMVLGWRGIEARITYTENYFDDDPGSYNGHGYGQDIHKWLSISSHEVGHLPQIDREGGFLGYVGEFIKQYAEAGEHDGALYEDEADRGSNEFSNFYKYVNASYGYGVLENLFNSERSQTLKIRTINRWWDDYQQDQSKKKMAAAAAIMGNIDAAEEGTYRWNGSAWVRN